MLPVVERVYIGPKKAAFCAQPLKKAVKNIPKINFFIITSFYDYITHFTIQLKVVYIGYKLKID